jgi:3-deoxy-D-manno-octulosonic-acid transferase
LINGSLSIASGRTKGFAKHLLSRVYRSIDRIYAISEEDARRFREVYHLSNVEYLGDTKYDQVVYRKKIAQKQELLPQGWTRNGHIILAGSIWPEDAVNIFPSFMSLLKKNPHWKIILVPHEPTKENVRRMKDEFSRWNPIRFSEKEQIEQHRIIIVDEIGHLAGLYLYADIAYVGGSFKQGIHNAMEPAIYEIPVLYGPVHKNSYEAIQLAAEGGGFVIKNSSDLDSLLRRFTENEPERKKAGQAAGQFARRHTGATEKLLNKWRNLLGDKK